MASTYPFSTTWTGKGDGTSWSDSANWTNGVPLTGANAADFTQDIATINNAIETTPFTLTIAGQFGAGEVDVNLVDPSGGPAISLTGSLGLSTNVNPGGSGFGVMNLNAGTFEIDGGTLGGGDVVLNGGTLAFGSFAKWGADTLAGALIDGNAAINNASKVVIEQSNFAIFDGVSGSGTATDTTITGGATLSVLGSLYLHGEIDVQSGVLSLDGGALNNWGGPGTLFADGGALNVTQSFTVNGDFTLEGGVTFTSADTLTVATGAELTLGSATIVSPKIVDLGGGTIDVNGTLSLVNTILENGTLILESGSTYTIDAASSLSGVTVTDNRPAGQTNWTGAAGDGNWTNPANWTNGVPGSGVNFTSDGQSIAVINNVFATTPSTIVIAGAVNAQDITLATTDPSNNTSVSLTGTLDLSWNGEGVNPGSLVLASGSFELDGGTLENANVTINGGALQFEQNLSAQETLANDTINGNWGVYSSVVVLSGNDTLQARGGGAATVTVNGGAQLLAVNGTLALDGVIDIQDPGDSTVFALEGANLSGYNGDAASIFLDGGTFSIAANTTFSNAVDIYGGGVMVFANSTSGFTVTIDASSVTTIGKAGGAQTTVNLNGGTLDVFGTLNLTNTFIENGTITVEAGATFNQDATDTLQSVTVQGGLQTATNWTGAGDGTTWTDPANWDNGVPLAGGPYRTLGQNVTTIDNGHGATAPFTVTIAGNQAAALVIVNATDPASGAAVRLTGSLNLDFNTTGNGGTLGVLDVNGGTFEFDGGTLDVGNINQLGGHVTFGSFATYGAATLNASGIAGDLTIGNASELIIAQNSFGAFNNAAQNAANTVTIADNSTLDIKGSLYSTNTIDIVSGSVILDGGSLGMGAGSKLVSEGGAFTVLGAGTLNTLEYDGAVSIGQNNALTIASGQTVLISNPGNPFAIDLQGGALAVLGTLDVKGTITGSGSLELDAGGTLMDATVNAPTASGDPAITINGNATLDNVAIDAPITFAPNVTLTVAGTEAFGNAADNLPMSVDLAGGVLDVKGVLDLTNTSITNGTIIIEAGGSLTSDAASVLTGVTVEQTLANGDLEVLGQNVAITSLQAITTAHGVLVKTGVSGGGTATGTPGEVTFNDPTNSNSPVGFTGAGVVSVTDGNGVSKTDFNGAMLDANVSGQTLDIATDTYTPDGGSFVASNGASLVIGDAAHAASNLTSGVFSGGISATGGSSVLFYGADGISVENGAITIDGTSSINVATAAGNVSLAQSITSIGSEIGTTGLDRLGILNLDGGASFIDPNAVTLYGTINLTGGTLSTGGLSGNDVVFSSGFSSYYASGVLGYGTLNGGFGSTSGNIYMEASGGTLTYTGTLSGFDTLIADANSTLVVNAALDSAGYANGYGIDLKAGSTIVLGGAIGDTTNIYASFQGSNATLQIKDPTGVTFRNIQSGGGAYSNDVIDLAGLVAAKLTDGSPDVTITRYVNGAVTVSIVPVGGGAATVITIDNAANTKVTFNPDDGKGGSQILLTADPVITAPGAVSATQGIASAISGISLADNSLGNGQTITVTVNDVNGLLSATGASGSGTTSLTVTGTLAQVNAALATLAVVEPGLGNDALAVSAVDSAGNTAATQAFGIYTEAPIVVGAFSTQTVAQNIATKLGNPYVYEQGALSGVDLTVTVSATTGILAASGSGISGSGTNAITLTGSQSVLNTELNALTVTEATAGTDTITFNATDAAGDKAPTTTSVISTRPAPVLFAPTSAAVTQNSITPLTGFSVSDPSALSYEQFTVTVTDTTGLLSATGAGTTGLGATSITLTGPLAQINTDLLTLAVDEQATGADTVHVTVTDVFGGTVSASEAIGSTHKNAPDLTVGAIIAPSTAVVGQTVRLTWTVTNSGDATATGPWTDNVYLASDAAGSNRVLAGSFTYTGTLAPGQSETETQTINVPGGFSIDSQTGTAKTYFVVQADPANQTGSLSGIQNHLTVAGTSTATTQTINWNAFLGPIQPLGIDATDYALFEQRFISEVGTTDASFATAIANAIATLDKTSTIPAGYTDAVDLLVAQAFDSVGNQKLAAVSAPSSNTSGLNSLLTLSYGSNLTSRNSGGVFGDGWSSEFNDVGQLGPMNGRGAQNVNPENQSYIVQYNITYVDQFGNYLGKSITYQVVAPSGSGIDFLDPSNPNSNYTQTNANGTIETFSGVSGLLVGISDGKGNAIAINRDATGVITGITTASGQPPVFTVNAQGNITSATDTAGNLVTYTYDASGTHLSSTTNSTGTTSYQYSNSANAFVQNALTQVSNPDGTTQAYTYDAQGNLASQSANGAAPTTYGYTGSNTVTRTDGNGRTTTYTYDPSGQPVAITDPSGNTFTIQRNAAGQITSLKSPTGQTYSYTYNANGHLTSYTDPLGHTVQDAYTSSSSPSSLTSVTDQNGNQTAYTYNAAGQLAGITQASGAGAQYLYNGAGLLTEKIEASGATIQYTYNAAGETTKEAFSDGTSQTYTYDTKGNLATATAADGSVTTYAYTAQGLLSSVTNAAGQVESYSYNAAGQETQRVEPDGSITNYTYTSTGKLAQITDGSGAVIAAYTYDASGALTGKSTGNGAHTGYTYNAGGSLTEIRTFASDGATTSKTDYTYDADGRIATAAAGDGTWTYTYDAANQLTHAVFASTNVSIANQDLAYTYDAAGNRTQTIFNGATTNYATNTLNQYTSSDGTTYSYDPNGNLVTKTSGGATTTYTYNIQNQLASTTDATGTTTYAYDALGNIATQTVNGVKTSYVSDPLAINSTATGALSAVAQAYDASGQATATYVYGNGLTAVTNSGTTSYYNADASGNITSLSGANGALTQTYDYTPTGTVLASTGSMANPFQFNGQVGAITQSNGLVNTRARYYDPTTGRFISQDPSGQSDGTNLYTYAANNSVNYLDANGQAFSPSSFLFAVGGFAISVAIGVAGFATAPVTATVFVLAGTGSFVYGVYKSATKDGTGIYVDSVTEINTNLANTLVGAFPGGRILSTAQFALSVIGSTDYFDANYAYQTYFGGRYVNGTYVEDRPLGGGSGDVHLTTFDGVHYDFQAVGEFVLVKSTAQGDNFQVQIRLSALGGNESAPTLTTEIGIQVGNQKVTFAADRPSMVYLDGVAVDLNSSVKTLSLAGGTITELSQDSYQIIEKTGEVVNISSNGTYFSYTVDLAPGAQPGSVEGLLGSFTGKANAFQLPDGKSLGATLTSDQLYQTFGNAWRITDATSLLNYTTGQTTATYTDLAHPTTQLSVASLPTAVVQAATAAVAAAGLTGTAAADALYDYLVTGNPSLITNAAVDGAQAPVTSSAVITPNAPPPPSIGISPATPTVTEVSNQTPVTFTISLTSTATADAVVNYTVLATAIDSGKTYFDAADFGGTLPSGTVTILAGQSSAQVTVEIPDSALGTIPDKWLAVGITTSGSDPVFASTAQVDVVNTAPVAGVAPQPLLEYLPGGTVDATQHSPALTQSGSSYTLDLGNVLQGSSVAAMQFALANLAPAPADGVSAVLLGATGNGFNAAGLATATLIAAGKAVTALTVQPLTSNLGALSTSVTFGDTEVNNSGYAGALANITLTVKENVIAAAQATIGTSTIALADARVGSTDAQTITVTNSAASGAAALDVTLGATSGITATGTISQLTAGASDSTSLVAGVSTASAGAQSGVVTLNLASDLGSGVAVPLALNQSVSVTGNVYRSAAAMTAQAVSIVHVGDAGSQALAISNSDAADGYSEGLRATVAGTTGGISAAGTTGLIAAGATDGASVLVSYSTATSGVVSGQVNLGLTSDGTGIDTLAPISIGTDAVAFNVQVDNYATAAIQKTGGTGTLTGSAATGYDINLGTITQGSGNATVDLAAFNSAGGLADLLSGSFAVTGDSAFTNTGFGAFGGLAAGQSDGALAVGLSTATDGTFSETITLTGTGSNASGYSGAVAPVTLTVHGQIASNTPVISGGTVVAGAITERAGVTGSTSPDVAAGTIAFTDANLSSSHAATVLGVAATGVTSGLPGNTTLLSLLSLGTLAEDSGSAPGSVAWNFAAADSTFDYLAAGETLTLTYAVQIAETGGKAATQDVTITVTGTNDLPVIAGGTTSSAALTEIVAGPTTPANDTASGTILFTDADLSDTHTATIAAVTATGTVAGLPTNATLLGLLGKSAVTEQSGATPGSVGWAFSAPDATFAYLLPGQTVTLTYAIDVSDNHGGTAVQDVTVTVTGAPAIVTHSTAAGTFFGAAFASSAFNYTAAGTFYLQTFYNASGAVVASLNRYANGGYTATVGGVRVQAQTVNADGSYDAFYTGSGTLLGQGYASSDNLHLASGALESQTFYNASGAVVATETYQANGGYTITIGGSVVQSRTVNGDGSYDFRTSTAGTILGTAYTGYDNAYTAAGFRNVETFYGASGNVIGSATYAKNGSYTVTLNGVRVQALTVNADGSYDAYYTGTGTFMGQAFASSDNLHFASGALEMQTYYNASGAVVASASYMANGGYTITVGGLVTQARTVNADGSYDIHYATGGTVLGTAYAAYDNAYTATGFRDAETFTDGSGHVVGSETFATNGGYSVTLGGVRVQALTVNADGSYDAYYTGKGTVLGLAYASSDNLHNAGGALASQTFYDASGAVLGVETYQANGGDTITIRGTLSQVQTGYADGSFLIENENVQGQDYTQAYVAYFHPNSAIAVSATLAAGGNRSSLNGTGLAWTDIAGVAQVVDGTDTFQLGQDTNSALDLTGAANATLAFGTGDGAQAITGFATSGGGADILSFSHTVFADYAHLMGATKQQGADLLITLDASDTVLLKNVTMSSFTSANAHFT